MNSISLESRQRLLQSYISRMPSLSTTATKVIQICNKPNTSPNDLFRVIGLDPVLTGQILKLINSAYYNLPNQVASLTRAIIMLGINTVKNLVLSTAVLKNLGVEKNADTLDMDHFWTHSICVGVTAKFIAASLQVPMDKREEYFVAGLLHDLGKIPLNNRFPEDYMDVLEKGMDEKIALGQAEMELLEIDHCQIGQYIAEKWKLGDTIHDSIAFHHNPEEAREENMQLASVVALANNYANESGIGSAGDTFIAKEQTAGLVKKFGLDWSKLLDLRNTVLNEIEKAQIFLKLST